MTSWMRLQNHKSFHHDTTRLYITGSILLEILGDRTRVTLGEITVGVIVGNFRVSIRSCKLTWSSILGSQDSDKGDQQVTSKGLGGMLTSPGPRLVCHRPHQSSYCEDWRHHQAHQKRSLSHYRHSHSCFDNLGDVSNDMLCA